MSHPTELFIDSKLSPHDVEVLSADLKSATRDGAYSFRFILQTGFLPTIGWLNRLSGLLKPLVIDKHHVEVSCASAQMPTLRQFGIHLIADIVETQQAT